MTITIPTHRPLRPSCRVGCVVAALLVTLGGLRLLAAAEPVAVPATRAVEAATTVASAPWPAALPDDVMPVRAADVVAVVEAQASRIECVPGACGFPRVTEPGDAAQGWSALTARAAAVDLPTGGSGPRPEPVAWFSAPLCPRAHACPSRLERPEALASRF